jgi:hypothetical protein
MPAATTIAILVNPNNSNAEPDTRNAEIAARGIGQQLVVLSARPKMTSMRLSQTCVQRRANVLLVNTDSFF